MFELNNTPDIVNKIIYLRVNNSSYTVQGFFSYRQTDGRPHVRIGLRTVVDEGILVSFHAFLVE